MVEAEAVEPKAQPVFRSIDDVILCLWVVEVEFRDVFHTKETEVVIWPVCEVEPVVVLAVFIVLSFFEERVFF